MKKYYYFIFLSVLFFVSCYDFKEVSVQGIQGFKIKKIDKKEMLSEVVVKLKNPNSFGFTVYSGKADVKVGSIPLGKATLEKKVHIPANSSGTYTLTLKTSFEKINFQDVISNFSFSSINKIKVSGYVKAGKFIFRKKINTEYESNITDGFNLNLNIGSQ